MKNEFLTQEEKEKEFDKWFWFWYHVLEVCGAGFILFLLCFGLIMADAYLKGNF